MNRITDNLPALAGVLTTASNLVTGWILAMLNTMGISSADRIADAAWQVGVASVIVIISFVLQKILRKVWPEKKK